MADKMDLIIYNDDGVFKVERKVWQQAANRMDAKRALFAFLVQANLVQANLVQEDG